ncbi:MAG: hypothetical protein WC217_02535 [Candidatus Paceibacterota bacterium]|jgi:hypothetical protein
MSTLSWIAVAFVFVSLFIVLPFLIVWYIRVSRPHSRNMAKEQAQLDKKTGTTADAPVRTKKGKNLIEGLREKLGSRIWTILVVLVAAAVFYWGLYKTGGQGLRLSQVGDWSWNHWLSLPIFCALVFVLIKMHKDALGAMAGTLESVLVGAVFLMFIGAPVGIWVKDLFTPQVICKDVSAHETRSCALNTAWSSWIKFAEGPENNGMQICFTPGGQFERTDVNGTTFWRFKAHEGNLVKTYRLFPGDRACPRTLS